MKATSIKGNSAAEIEMALQQSMSGGFKPTLAIVFVSLHQDRNSICRLLDSAGIAVFGATTNGQFIDEETKAAAAVLLLLDINPACFSILFEEYPDKNYREKAKMVARKSLEKFTNPAFLISCSNTETD